MEDVAQFGQGRTVLAPHEAQAEVGYGEGEQDEGAGTEAAGDLLNHPPAQP